MRNHKAPEDRLAEQWQAHCEHYRNFDLHYACPWCHQILVDEIDAYISTKEQ